MFRVTSVRCPRGCGTLTLDCDVYTAKQCTGYYNDEFIGCCLAQLFHVCSFPQCYRLAAAGDLQEAYSSAKSAMLSAGTGAVYVVLCTQKDT